MNVLDFCQLTMAISLNRSVKFCMNLTICTLKSRSFLGNSSCVPLLFEERLLGFLSFKKKTLYFLILEKPKENKCSVQNMFFCRLKLTCKYNTNRMPSPAPICQSLTWKRKRVLINVLCSWLDTLEISVVS